MALEEKAARLKAEYDQHMARLFVSTFEDRCFNRVHHHWPEEECRCPEPETELMAAVAKEKADCGVEAAYAKMYQKLEKSNAARESYRSTLSACYISISALLESSKIKLSPEVKRRLDGIKCELEAALSHKP